MNSPPPPVAELLTLTPEASPEASYALESTGLNIASHPIRTAATKGHKASAARSQRLMVMVSTAHLCRILCGLGLTGLSVRPWDDLGSLCGFGRWF